RSADARWPGHRRSPGWRSAGFDVAAARQGPATLWGRFARRPLRTTPGSRAGAAVRSPATIVRTTERGRRPKGSSPQVIRLRETGPLRALQRMTRSQVEAPEKAG